MPLTSAILAALEVSHPLFFVFDTELRLCHVGPRYAQLAPSVVAGAQLHDVFQMDKLPMFETFEQILQNQTLEFVFRVRATPKLQAHGRFVQLTPDQLVFLGAPLVVALADIADAGMSLADFPSGDMLLALLATRHSKELLQSDIYRLLASLRETQNELQACRGAAEPAPSKDARIDALGRLVASMAHEINTPLGVARIASSLIDERRLALADQFTAGAMTRGQLQEFLDDTGEAVGMLTDGLRRVAELVASFRQIVVDPRAEERRVVRLVPYIEEVLEEMGGLLSERRIGVVVVGDRQLTDLVHPVAFARMTRALVQNVLDHAWPSATSALLRIGVATDGRTCTLTCEDNGVGIDEGSRERVFEPFFSTRRMPGGPGLGLYTAYNIVHDLLGGSIRADAVSPHGCCITAQWPATRTLAP